MRNGLRLLLLVVVLAAFAAFPALAQDDAAISLIVPQGPIGLDTEFDVIIQVNGGGVPVDAAAAYLDFDPAVFQVVRVQTGSDLPITLQNGVDNAIGQFNFAAGRLGGDLPTTSFTLATVTLRAIAEADAAALTLNTSGRRQTDVAALGTSVIGSSVGALVMVTKDAAPAAIDPNAPVFTGRPDGIADIVSIDSLLNQGGGAGTLVPAAVPFTADLTNPAVFTADGATQSVVGTDAVWALGSSSAAATLSLAQPINLAGLSGAQLALQYSGGTTGRVEISFSGNGVWYTAATLLPSAEASVAVVNLADYVGRVVNVRLVVDAVEAGAAGLSISGLAVTGTPIEIGAAAEGEATTDGVSSGN